MADLVDGLARLDLAVDDADAVLEERRQIAAGEVAILVDGGGQDGAAVLPIPARVVGAAAEEGDAEGGSADDHSLTSCRGTPCPSGRRCRRPFPAVPGAVRGRC